MKRGSLLSAILLILLLGIATLLVLQSQKHSQVNRSNYERIAAGMSREEVESILGGAGDELPSLATVDVASDERSLFKFPPPHELRTWRGRSHQIGVIFDLQGRVAGKSYQRDQDAPLWDQLVDALAW